MGKVISFPHLGNYYIVFNYFLSRVLKCTVIIPPKSTRKTIELGSKYSPDFVCVPFKYNLGNYIEALDMGANVLVQGGGGCRYGYYGELQEKILRDLGYDFEFYNLIYDNHISLKKGYKFCKKMNRKCNIFSLMYYLINSLFMIIFIDKIERYIRLNMGFELIKGEFERVEKEYFNSFRDNGIIKNIIMYFIILLYNFISSFNSFCFTFTWLRMIYVTFLRPTEGPDFLGEPAGRPADEKICS